MRAILAVLATVTAAFAGCEAQPKPTAPATTPSVLDVTPQPASNQHAVYAMAYVPPPAESASSPAYLPPGAPAAYQPPPVAPPSDRAPQADIAPAGRGSYTVKHGDTLYHIAKEQYGDGKKWRQIALANPGVTPATLKAGQKLVMP